MAMFDCQRIDGRRVLRLRGNYHDVDGFAQHLVNLVWDLLWFVKLWNTFSIGSCGKL